MTKDYHLTQEQALEIAMHISANLVIRNYQEDLQEFANAVLDEVLGEPNYYGLTKDHTWLSISHEQYIKLKPNMRKVCYAPKELT
jgi:hypothetical protein